MNNEKSSFYSFCLIAMLLCIFTNATSQPFITGDTLSSNISYVNIKDTILPLVVKGYFEFDLDIDADNINDIGFTECMILRRPLDYSRTQYYH